MSLGNQGEVSKSNTPFLCYPTPLTPMNPTYDISIKHKIAKMKQHNIYIENYSCVKKIIAGLCMALFFVHHLYAQTSQTKEITLSALQVALPSTTSMMLSIDPKIGMMVYNTNPTIEGSIIYPSIGKGIYIFDGKGWLAHKTKEISAIKSTIDLPQFSNAILLIDKGEFTPPAPQLSGGSYYFIRNTSTQQIISIANIIDFDADAPKNLFLSPKQGSVLIYSNGENWYRIL